MTLPNLSSRSDSAAPSNQPSETSIEFWLLCSVLLAWLGVSICLLLLQSHDLGGSIFCGARAGCEAILSSRYSVMAGIPLPWLGLAFYVTVLVLLLAAYGIGKGALSTLFLEVVKWLTIAGVSFSASLMLIQFVILRGFCPLCTSSAIVAIGLFIMGGRCRRLAEEVTFRGSRWVAITLGGFAVMSGALIAVGGNAYRGRLEEALARPVAIDLSTARVSGPQDAKVQIVVFSDFQCPMCAKVAPVLKKIREEFPNEVMVAYRYFPIEGHARAFPAAIAAECAAEQGAFWEYHDQIFAEPTDLSDARFLAIAQSFKLDRERYLACLSSKKALEVVEASYKDAVEMGLPGVPLIFLNGRMMNGAPDYNRLVKEINHVLHPEAQSHPSR